MEENNEDDDLYDEDSQHSERRIVEERFSIELGGAHYQKKGRVVGRIPEQKSAVPVVAAPPSDDKK